MNDEYLFLKDGFEEFASYEGKEYFNIGTLSKINLLIGPNNSRKSRFLRNLFTKTDVVLWKDLLRLKLDEFISFYETHPLLDSKFEILIPVRYPESSVGKFLTILQNYSTLISHKNTKPFFEIARGLSANNDFVINNEFISSLYDAVLIHCFKPTSVDDTKSPKPFPVLFRISLLEIVHLIPRWTSMDRKEQDFIHTMSSVFDFRYTSYPTNQIQLIEYFIELTRLARAILEIPFQRADTIFIYIPTLRSSIRLFTQDKDGQRMPLIYDIYKYAASTHYGLKFDNESKQCFTGITLYEDIRNKRNGKRTERDMIEKFSRFVGATFFNNESLDIVALLNDDHQQQNINFYLGVDVERNIHDLGDGVNNLIILLYKIFTSGVPTWFFIEEPENSLHPGLQHLFMKTILSHPDVLRLKHKYFITTHSNHFLNFATSHPNNISILRFQGNYSTPKTIVSTINAPSIDLLDDLGTFNFSVFMANCSLWVEGISDRLITEAYLLAYTEGEGKHTFQQNLHYCFFEYGGSLVGHYLFNKDLPPEGEEKISASFLSNRICLVADQDLSSQKQERHKRYSSFQSSYFKYLTTQGVEIENTIAPNILTRFMHDRYEYKGSIKGLRKQYYYTKKLGDYLKGKIDTKVFGKMFEKPNSEHYIMKSDVKKELAKYVLRKVKEGNITWSDIKENKHAAILAEEVYKFIASHNANFIPGNM